MPTGSFYDSFTLKSVPMAQAEDSLDLGSSLAIIRDEFSEATRGGGAQAKDSVRDVDGAQSKDGGAKTSPRTSWDSVRDFNADFDAEAKGGGDSDAQAKEAKGVQRACSSSTSSLYVSSTLQVPDVDHLLVSIAVLLETLIQSEELDFDIFSHHIPPSVHNVPNPTHHWCRPLTPDHRPCLPQVDMHVIYSFMKELFVIAQWSPECNIIAMVLISRMCASTDVSLNLNNWDKIILCALLVAQKVWDDIALSNTDFPQLWQQAFPGKTTAEIDLTDVNRMERTFLEVLHYDVNVTRSTYTQFYFELNALTASLGTAPKKTAVNKLSARRAEQLEMRSATFTSQIMSLQDKKKAVAQGSKSATLGMGSHGKRPMIIN